jgi:alcohol dehydrogenase class IV
MAVTRFSAPTRVVAGLGSISGLKDVLATLGRGPVAVVADRGVAEAGVLDRVLAGAGRRATVVGLVEPDPHVDAAEAAAAAAGEAGCGIVLMVGGGSALSVGKAVALRLTNPAPVAAYEGRDRAPRTPVPSLAVPTTAGSGSEVSGALVLHDAGRDRLVVVRGHGYEPDVAVLDGELLVSLPHAPMLFAAFDALSHALESLWARGASATTDALALAAARQIRDTLPRALAARDPIDLQRLLEASMMANLACGNAGLGLVHALSSATSVRLPHGLQNGVLLPHVAAFNRPVLSTAALAEVEALDRLYAELRFEPRFDARALPPGAAEAMVAAALGNPFRDNNRRRAVSRQLHALLRQAGVPAAAAPVAGVGVLE